MTVKFHAEHSNELPKLGWVAVLDGHANTANIVCGQGVEIGDGFVVEGVWTGPFNAGGFHRAEHFFGSGLRVEGKKVFAVPSHGLVDRVVLANRGNLTFISNSLLLLLATTGDTLNPSHDYRGCCHSIMAGVQNYDPEIPVRSNDQSLLWQGFHTPQQIGKHGLQRLDTPSPRQFESFSAYHQALLSALQMIMENARDPARRNPVASCTTTSTGYDSVAVSALAKEFGVTQSYTTIGGKTLDGQPLEDGRPLASALGLKALDLRSSIPNRWHEQLMLAATFDGRESVYSNMFQQLAGQQAVTCLWSGYHGDKLWDRFTAGKYLNPDLRRGDVSGFNLSEVRLDVGFINFCVPFMFASSIRSLVNISNSPEMKNWQVGGSYDRPIPRRIAEERGVSRQLFGQKKSVIMEYYTYCRNPELAQEYKQHLASQHGFGPLSRARYQIAEQLDYLQWRIAKWSGIRTRHWSVRDRLRPGASNLANTLYVWTVNESKEVYYRSCADALNGVRHP